MKMKNATLRYMLINMTYFAVFCGVHAFASVFLLANGFTNTQIGIVLCIANVLSVVVQPVIAGIIDKPGPITNRNVSMVCTCLMLAGSLILYIGQGNFWLVGIVYALLYMTQMAYQPLIIAMNFEYQKAGADIKFGFARGMGSIGFAITSVILGQVVAKQGPGIVQIVDAAIMVFALVIIYFFKLPENERAGEDAVKQETAEENGPKAHNNLLDFTKTYPKFMIFCVGVILYFFAHNAINDYLIQIITPLGGTEKQLGYAIFIAAALELPTMACIGFMLKKISCHNLLRISGVSFFIKTIVTLVAVNMIGIYVSELFQLTAYAVLIPAAAYYVEDVMEELDKVKGQAFVNVAVTLGGVFSSLICGRILDARGPKAMLTVAAAVCLIGVVIAWFSVERTGQKQN
ncbi:MAG: MFS transporter [Lachnospiraceae bacterium]|nr:MFS transporter [Lachnospiraceae bacterium]